MGARVNFYLKPGTDKGKKVKKKERPILMYFSFSYMRIDEKTGRPKKKTERIVLSTGLEIDPIYWHSTKQTPKPSYYPNDKTLIGQLNDLKERIEAAYDKYRAKDIIPSAETLRLELLPKEETRSINPAEVEKTPNEVFYNKFNEFMDVQTGLQAAPRTIQKYRTTIQGLKEYEAMVKRELSFENIDTGFYNSYKAYMLKRDGGRISAKKEEKGLVNDTISKYIGVVKTFMKWAESMKYHKNDAYKLFEAKKKTKNEQIALTKVELDRLMRLDLNENKRLERVRDIFVFACHTGQRWSDLEAFKATDVKGDNWHLLPVKTRNEIQIPLSIFGGVARAILVKYNYALPKISGVKFNVYIKEVGLLAGINSTQQIRRFVGKNTIEIKEPKYKFLSSHVARRTFITIALQSGVPPIMIMKITGHKDMRTMMKYEFIDHDAVKDAFEGIQLAAPALRIVS